MSAVPPIVAYSPVENWMSLPKFTTIPEPAANVIVFVRTVVAAEVLSQSFKVPDECEFTTNPDTTPAPVLISAEADRFV